VTKKRKGRGGAPSDNIGTRPALGWRARHGARFARVPQKLSRASLAAAVILLSFATIPRVFAQGDEYDEARNLVQRVQDDLHSVQPNGHKDRDRINDALKHLSELDKTFTKDKFHKGPLSDAIGNLQDILDHNTLEPRERDVLNADVHDLRELRLYKGR
jgi:hypothetical protein